MFSIPKRFYSSILLLILAFAYMTRMYQLYLPNDYMFDEVYHAVTAKLIARNDPRAFEWWNPPPEPDTAVDWLHPPVAKYTQALSILAFGENSFGWRFSSVIFGTLTILMVFHLSKELFKNNAVALLAAFLASLDGLLLVQSRIAMNDIHLTFFVVLSFYLYAKWRHSNKLQFLFLTGISLGLSISTKWSGVYVLATVLGLEMLKILTYLIKHKLRVLTKKKTAIDLLKDIGRWVVALVIIPPLIYLASYSMMFLQGKDWQHFVELHKQIWHYQTHLKASHPYQSVPWQWILNTRPVWYNVKFLTNERADVYASGNTVVYWTGAIAMLASVFFVVFQTFKLNKNSLQKVLEYLNQSEHVKILSLYFLLWLPWCFSPRIMFFYHYTPAVPLLCILLAYWLIELQKFRLGRSISRVIVVLAVAYFMVWYPHWVSIPINTEFKDAVYFRFENWR